MKVCLLGCGTMGNAIASGLLKEKMLTADDFIAVVASEASIDRLQGSLGIRAVLPNSTADAVGQCSVVILATKPWKVASVLSEVAVQAALEDKLLISIAAGVTLPALQGLVPQSCTPIRVMTNTPAQIQCGMSCISAPLSASKETLSLVERMFSCIGSVATVDESQMDTVTALAGSGPAFCLLMLQSLADGAVKCGLGRALATKIASQVMQGAARLLDETGDHPAALKDKVTTPGGCTIAGLMEMERAAVPFALAHTITVTKDTASQLGEQKK